MANFANASPPINNHSDYSCGSLFHCEALTMLGENPRHRLPDEELEINNLLADFEDEDAWTAFDDVKGTPLNPQLVREARERELQYLRDRQVYSYASTSEAIKRCGKKPLRLKWVDTNKGGNGQPQYPFPPCVH